MFGLNRFKAKFGIIENCLIDELINELHDVSFCVAKTSNLETMKKCEYGPVLSTSLKRRISHVVPIKDILRKNVIESQAPEPSEVNQ